MRFLYLAMVMELIGVSLGISRAAAPQPLTLRWYGQSGFLLTSPGGTAILMDPFSAEAGYPALSVKADAVTVSHDHFDHNHAAAAKPGAKVIPGLLNGDWAKVAETVGDVKIRAVPTFHDDREGRMRGKNAVFIFETGSLRVVHLGDLGHPLSEEQVAAIGRTDVLLVPVGGVYTIDAASAGRVVEQLKPKLVIPMHYKTDRVKNLPLAPVDRFLLGKPKVEKPKGNQLEIRELPAETTIVVLGYKP